MRIKLGLKAITALSAMIVSGVLFSGCNSEEPTTPAGGAASGPAASPAKPPEPKKEAPTPPPPTPEKKPEAVK